MNRRPLRVAMVAYANYFTDARIKNYVDALLDAGASVDVFALGRERGEQQFGNLYVKNVGVKYTGAGAVGYITAQLVFLVQAIVHLARRSMKGKYDIIHAHNMPDVIALAGLPFKLFGTKVILDVHDTMPEAYATKYGYALDGWPVKLLIGEELVSAFCSDRVITTNRMHKEVLAGHGIPDRKIDLIYNVGNGKIFKPRRHSQNGSELWLGYHGTVARRLGVLLIVDALALVKSECPGVRFLCVGEGDDRDEMERRANEKGVADMIEWRPFTDVEKLPEVLQKVQVGVIGNLRDTEMKRNYMLPVKMLEYAAMEIPTIVPRLKIIERYFDDSSAFFYETDDACSLAQVIRSIYNDRGLICSRVDGLRRFNVEYNWDVMAKRYLTMIGELVGS
ncbi:MAG: glycosyltransferase [Ignavibacteriae bacterium]|nr:glycosyltransferase [Ignavibacteriota bacterium]